MWKPIGCTCRICTPFIPGVGFKFAYSCIFSFLPDLYVCLSPVCILSILDRIKLAVN